MMNAPLRRSVSLRVAALLVAGVAVVGSVGCSGQRSLLAVRESGERAMERGNVDGALADFEEYVQRLPGDPVGRYNYGTALLASGQPRQAREQLAIAHTIDLRNDDYFDALVEALYQSEQHDELFRMLRQRTLDRGRFRDYAALARFAERLGDADQAEQALLTAAKLDRGSSAEPQLALSEFYASIGDDRRALERLRMAYYLDPNDPDIVRRIRGFGEIPGPSFGLVPVERNPGA